jgi:uncharacterized protein involved in exopolysaccharide biosynthesis
MTRFADSKIDEHLKNVLIQKNNKIELLENEVLEKELDGKELLDKIGNLEGEVKLQKQNYKDLTNKFQQASQKKEKLKVGLTRNMSNISKPK